ncbi:MAG TPA: hypothetical protein VK982_11115 [Bacteroidales bacterium]|nr:hypothetical protein [Bacteroidales bacterium]
MRIVKIIYDYLITDKQYFFFIDKIISGETSKGVQIQVTEYFITNWLTINKKTFVYWKPFKKYIREDALPSLTENNKKGKDPFVNVWFEIENLFTDYNDLKISSKLNHKNPILNSLNKLLKEIKNGK